jgi:2-polyprenyl-6-hydroxyphenyl methylase/3-demethylubiquinone-9 3-methyltransferase
MRDWTDERTRGEGAYYERSRFGLHWTGFGEPHPFVEAYRRPLAEILNAVVEAGWTFDRIEEPRPLEEMRAVAARTFDKLSRSPALLCIRARR